MQPRHRGPDQKRRRRNRPVAGPPRRPCHAGLRFIRSTGGTRHKDTCSVCDYHADIDPGVPASNPRVGNCAMRTGGIIHDRPYVFGPFNPVLCQVSQAHSSSR